MYVPFQMKVVYQARISGVIMNTCSYLLHFIGFVQSIHPDHGRIFQTLLPSFPLYIGLAMARRSDSLAIISNYQLQA